MSNKRALLAVSLLALTALACGITNPLQGILGGGNTSSNLWSDVPRMEGLDDSNQAMPLPMRIFMQFMMGQVLSGAGAGDADIVAFTTSSSPADIQAFYSADRMHFEDWETESNTNCLSGAEQGFEGVGLFCMFTKQEDAGEALLLIIANPAENNQTNVYFVRVQGNSGE